MINCKSYTKQELGWLNKIIHQHTNPTLDLEISQVNNGTQQLAITYKNEILNFKREDFALISEQAGNSNQNNLVGLSDLINIIFTCLTRAEEYENFQGDNHQRFTSEQSYAFKTGTLERPIVDECLQIIREAVACQWPQLKLAKRQSKTFVTCDIDRPYELYTINKRAFIKKIGSHLLKRDSLDQFRRIWSNYRRTYRGDYSGDPNNTFDWMMDVNEKVGNKMAFYFLVDQTVSAFDAHYKIDEPRIRQLMRRIYDRGHEIGLHASYSTYKDPAQMKSEADKLRQVMEEEYIKQDEIGSRQHYLRWSTPETARNIEAAGIVYDTSLGYADHIGFRCGTSHEYPMFDIENQRVLKLRQKPLILMEASVFSVKYMNMDYTDSTLEYMKKIKERCISFGGVFNLLWHNSSFKSENDKIFYQELINN